MRGLLFAGLVALLAGTANGFQNPITSMIGRRAGLMGAAFAVHLGGAVVAGLLLLLTPTSSPPVWRAVPWLTIAAGALGVVFITSVSYTIPRIGLATTVGLFITAQLAISTWLDHHGLMGLQVRPLDPGRLAGLGLLILGAWLVLRK